MVDIRRFEHFFQLPNVIDNALDVHAHQYSEGSFAAADLSVLIPCRRTRRHAAVPQPHVRVARPLFFKKLLAILPLAVALVPNFEPACVLRQIRSVPSLRNDAFKIVFAGKLEERFAISLNVIAVKKAFTSIRNNPAEPELAVAQRQIPEVFAAAESPHLFVV